MEWKQIEDAVWRATVLSMGLDPDAESSQSRVRISWPTSETGNPNWKREENVVFLRIIPGFDPYSKLHDVTHEYDEKSGQLSEVVSYHRALQITWVCYGPDADRDADMIRIGVLRAPIRAYLREHSIAIHPDIGEPVRVPEPDETGEWWERSDLTAQAYELVARKYPSDYMVDPPAISFSTHG